MQEERAQQREVALARAREVEQERVHRYFEAEEAKRESYEAFLSERHEARADAFTERRIAAQAALAGGMGKALLAKVPPTPLLPARVMRCCAAPAQPVALAAGAASGPRLRGQ